MINIKDSSVNGWYFKELVNGVGKCKCTSCGKEKDINAPTMNFPICECKESTDEED